MNQTIRELKRQFAGERLAPEQLKELIRAGYVYRNGDDFGATPASLRETLDRVCFVLTDDHNVMPAALCYQINASCKPDEDLQSGANYAAGAAVVQANFETWRRSTTDQLGFASCKRASCSLKGPPREAVEASPIG